MLYILFRYLLWPLFMIIMRPQVYNLKGLRVKGGAIYACNHLSMLDPVMIAFLSPRIVHFMAKKELFNLRFQNATNQLENTSRIKEVRRNIARIQGAITAKANA